VQAGGITVGTGAPVGKTQATSGDQGRHQDPGFGRDYYEVLSSAKIVLNESIDMPRADRGNMRCFAALGSNSLLLTDEGNYPDGMSNGSTMITYDPPEAAAGQIRILLKYREQLTSIARAGHKMMSTRYSKEVQWRRFEALVASI
jgi:Glycosyl transferases group 1